MSERRAVEMRLIVEADVPYVAKTWVESYRRESPWTKGMTNGIYYPAHRQLVNQIIATSPVLVACNPQNASHLVGFCCAERRCGVLTVHYLAVKYPFRGFGVARMLMKGFEYDEKEPVVCTHWTYAAATHHKKGYPIVYNPYIMFSEYKDFWGHPDAETYSRKQETEQRRDKTADPTLGKRFQTVFDRQSAFRKDGHERPEVRAPSSVAAGASGPSVRGPKRGGS